VLESTTYPGTTTDLLVPILEDGSHLCAGEDFYVGFSPERIDPGNPVWNLVNTPKVVSGIDEESLLAVQSFYDTLVETTVPVRSTKEAELTKLLENTFRHVNVALVNELAIFATGLGINIWDVIQAASSKPFGFLAFTQYWAATRPVELTTAVERHAAWWRRGLRTRRPMPVTMGPTHANTTFGATAIAARHTPKARAAATSNWRRGWWISPTPSDPTIDPKLSTVDISP
jgi:hypothetical protein